MLHSRFVEELGFPMLIKKVPVDVQVSHEVSLYTVPKSERSSLDIAENMKTQDKQTHRDRHKVG